MERLNEYSKEYMNDCLYPLGKESKPLVYTKKETMNLENFKQLLNRYEEYLDSVDYEVLDNAIKHQHVKANIGFIAWLARNIEERE